MMLDRARGIHPNRNPFEFTEANEVERAFDRLRSLEHAEWTAAFGALAAHHAEAARDAEGRGDAQQARTEWLAAYNYERVARYPAPTSPVKAAAYAREREHYARAARYFDPHLEVVQIPFRGRPGEGDAIVAHLRCPRDAERPAVVVSWGGIDSYKEERRAEPFLAKGHAVLAVDMPGAGEAPIKGSLDAERMWDAIFDWVATRDDLDPRRVALFGGSTGGYWATKLGHTHRERIRAAVNHGGPVHHAFERSWIERSTRSDYPFELLETLAWTFGLDGVDAYIAFAPRLSLLDLGLLDRECAPLLLVDGVDDAVFPIADHELLLRHGSPKSARFFPGGHMGFTPRTLPTIVDWLDRELRRDVR
jgi:pimeloyl-ACP methyl ester carboxylesterase